MEINRQLMEKFFAGLCSEEEAEEVIRCLNESPDLMEQYFSRNEWDAISDSNENVPHEVRDEMLEEIRKAANIKESPVYTLKRYWFSAAAILLLCVGLMILNRYMYSKEDSICEKHEKTNTSAAKDSLLVLLNTGDEIKNEKLPDGSLVKLSPNSAITICKDFIKDKREVQLTGQAYFKVVKDPQHPFIVYSNGVSTTAIGTSFTITALKDGSNVRVDLHTGKVRIADISGVKPKWKETFLVAKQSFYLDIKRSITKIETEPSLVSKRTNISLPEAKKPVDLVFDQEPLQSVFEKLQTQFNIKLEYTTSDLEGLHFTGTIHPGDQLEKVLKNISLLNDLNFIKQEKGFKIIRVN